MHKYGKSINLFLIDGSANGRIKCTLANWTGIAYKIPRVDLDKCKKREDLSQSGVYFLFGVSDITNDNVVYIGQAGVRKNGEGLLYRLIEHKRDLEKDYWTEAIVFTTSNNSFGPTEISYLENRFCKLAKETNRYVVKNSNEPTSGNITEEKESELEEFIEYAKIIIGTLGHKMFEPLINDFNQNNVLKNENDEKELILFLERKVRKSGQVVKATCKQTKEGFVVLKGSYIEITETEKNISLSVKERRRKAKIDENRILQENELFSSPSSAGSFVIGNSVNGLEAWKTIEGISLKDIEEK